jgi:hypothetical protein
VPDRLASRPVMPEVAGFESHRSFRSAHHRDEARAGSKPASNGCRGTANVCVRDVRGSATLRVSGAQTFMSRAGF